MSDFALVQDTGRGTGTNTFSRQFPATPTAGNLLVFPCSWVAANSNNVDVDITDDVGTITWHAAVTSVNEFGARTKIFYAFDIPALASNPTITITRQGAVTTRIQGSCQEYSGFGTNDPLSAVASNRAGATSAANTGTTAAVGELDALVVIVVQQSTITTGITVESVTPAWTQLYDGALSGINGRGEADYRIVAAGGTQIGRWTFGAATNYSASIAAFVSGLVPTAGVRANQAVQTAVTQESNPPLRTNQVTQTAVTQAAPQILLNQVVLTIVVLLGGTPPIVPRTGCPTGLPVTPIAGEPGCAPDLQ